MTEDISAPGLDFVFGQADMIDRVAVVSLYRLWDKSVSRPDNRVELLTRLLRETIHEVGHTYGLGHCPDLNCVMHFSRSLVDIDRKDLCFCSHCRARLEK